MFRIICLIIGYFIGCIQPAFIIGKLIGKIDIRNFGSGNAGFTNVTRVMGAKAGIFVFVCDILKGIIAFLLCSYIFDGNAAFWPGLNIVPGIYAAMGAILGHDFPFYIKFKGGKGMAATLGVILCIDFRIAALTYIVGLCIVILTRYISLASLCMTLLTVVLLIVFKYPPEAVLIMAFLALLSCYQHLANINRLIKGEENKFNFKKQKY